MRIEENNDRRILSIEWIIDNKLITYDFDKKNEEAYFSSEYYGDHTENWIILNKDGKEIGRYNAKDVNTIVWKNYEN